MRSASVLNIDIKARTWLRRYLLTQYLIPMSPKTESDKPGTDDISFLSMNGIDFHTPKHSQRTAQLVCTLGTRWSGTPHPPPSALHNAIV
jgi:hypothetical protein